MKKVTTKADLIKKLRAAKSQEVLVNGFIFSMSSGVYKMRFFEVFTPYGELIATYEGEDYLIATDSLENARKILEAEVTSFALATA